MENIMKKLFSDPLIKARPPGAATVQLLSAYAGDHLQRVNQRRYPPLGTVPSLGAQVRCHDTEAEAVIAEAARRFDLPPVPVADQ